MGAADVNASAETGQRKASRLQASTEQDAQDEHVATAFAAEKGNTRCRIRFRGGVQISAPPPELRIGDPSRGLKVVSVSLKAKTLIFTAYLKQAGEPVFTVRSGWKLKEAMGADVKSHEGDLYTMVLRMPPGAVPSAGSAYVKVCAQLRFANR